ncbi:MAG: hypothetical protein ACPGWS_01380 [Solirubrobacterales bacterium]
MKPFTPKQLSALAGQRLNGLQKRLLATAKAEAARADELAYELAQTKLRGCELERARPDREKVLITIESDGTVTAYANRWIDVRVAHVPKVKRANQDLADQIAEHLLPAAYRDLWMPGLQRASGNHRLCETAAELTMKQNTLAALDFCDRVLQAIQ